MATLDGFLDITPVLRAGVYALTWRDVVVYVGQSRNLLGRLGAHRARSAGKTLPSWHPVRRVQFDGVHVYPCGPDDLDALEREMINRFRPRHNVHHKPPSGTPMLAPVDVTIGDFQWRLNREPEVIGIVRRA